MPKPQNRNPYQASEGVPQQGGATLMQLAFEKDVVVRALIMAVIVGSILVMINHGMCIYVGHFDFTCFWQSALTFLVPYSVSTISSVLAVQKNNS